ncbi:hypothetical protein RJ641_017350 [Dillenia turbinata]|uniref:Methyltransferase type 11 domain-containing protein n=1 Tax=Dillenia turbinata TaxID=194707 RepID=A0AAN8V059_9MAGN
MERHIQTLLNRVSFISITLATFTLFYLLLQTPQTCLPIHHPHQRTRTQKPTRFPSSTCDLNHRNYLSLTQKNKKLYSSKPWLSQVTSYSNFFAQLKNLNLLENSSRVLCVSAGAGHEVEALKGSGVADVIGVEVVDSAPLVSRADPHNLPFFDDVFDLGYSGHLAEALFPLRFAGELERTVRSGGVVVVVMEECGANDVNEIMGLFRKTKFVSAVNVTLIGKKMTRIIMQVDKPS